MINGSCVGDFDGRVPRRLSELRHTDYGDPLSCRLERSYVFAANFGSRRRHTSMSAPTLTCRSSRTSRHPSPGNDCVVCPVRGSLNSLSTTREVENLTTFSTLRRFAPLYRHSKSCASQLVLSDQIRCKHSRAGDDCPFGIAFLIPSSSPYSASVRDHRHR